jgi:predicted TIM-barrel fold metal-dependent hydrolase
MGWRDEDPGLPIKLGPCSNGEYDPEDPVPPVLREAIRRAREACEHNARRTGMTRREFLLSACGAATVLGVLSACSGEAARQLDREPGGSFSVSPEATMDPEAAMEEVGGEEFVFDIQGHLLEYELNPAAHDPVQFWSRFPQRYCGEEDPRDCFSIEHFMEEMFLKSDTNMIVLSSLPLPPDGPLSLEVMDQTRRVSLALCRDERIILSGNPFPNLGPIGATLDMMEEATRKHDVAAWKVFTHYPDVWDGSGNGWWFDDHDPSLPQVGERFIDQARRLDVPIVCAHKGLSGGSPYASPADIGPAAARHPDVAFVVYHSGHEVDVVEGPYTRTTAHLGINRLIRSMKRAGVRRNENVYAEIGSTWRNVMRYPDQAAHVLGKLLRYVGEDNVLWGTDCLFYGSPQDQIQALRTFHISEELQERYGYPRLTKEIKQKILGLNAARLFDVDPITVPCDFSRRELAEIRTQLPLRNRTLGPSTPAQAVAFRAAHQGWP